MGAACLTAADDLVPQAATAGALATGVALAGGACFTASAADGLAAAAAEVEGLPVSFAPFFAGGAFDAAALGDDAAFVGVEPGCHTVAVA